MNSLFAELNGQLRFATSFSLRDSRRRGVSLLLISGAVFYYDTPARALVLAIVAFVFEGLRFVVSRNFSRSGQHANSFWAVQFLFTYFGSSLSSGFFGVVLMQSGFATAQIIGLLWITLIAVHTVSANTMIPVLCWFAVIHDALEKPFWFNGTAVHLEAALGVAYKTDATSEVIDICDEADQRMYRAKQRQKQSRDERIA